MAFLIGSEECFNLHTIVQTVTTCQLLCRKKTRSLDVVLQHPPVYRVVCLEDK